MVARSNDTKTQPADAPLKSGDAAETQRPGGDRAADGSPPSKEFVARIAKLFTRCEGCFDSINWNDNGHGISIGMAQWNQKRGEMPDLLERWSKTDPRRFSGIFGPYASKLLDESYVRSATIEKNSDLAQRLDKALKEPAFQKVQLEMINEKVVRAVGLARENGHDSELFVAQVADIANQMGWGGVQSALRRSKAAEIEDEMTAVKALQRTVRHKRPNGTTRDASLVAEFSDSVGCSGTLVKVEASAVKSAGKTEKGGG